MTIKGLYKLIKSKAPTAIKEADLTSLRGEYLFIDASQFIYQWVAAGVSNSIYNSDGNHINHIQGCIWRTTRLISAGIRPVYVFDGPPPAEKSAIIVERRAARDAGAVRVPPGVFTAVAKLLELMGVPTIQAMGEAEATAAALARAHGGAVATEDSDCLLFGAPRMIRGVGAKDTITVVNLEEIRSGLGVTQEEFIDLGIILGCDYTEKPAGIGPARGYKLITTHRSIEAALTVGAFVPPARFDYTAARGLFTSAPLLGDYNLDRRQPDLISLNEYIAGHGLTPGRFAAAISILEK